MADRLEATPPDYSIYAEAAENLFSSSPPIAALEEYGIPIQIAKKLSPYLDQYDLDRTIQDLRTLDIGNLTNLSEFEVALISSAQSTI